MAGDKNERGRVVQVDGETGVEHPRKKLTLAELFARPKVEADEKNINLDDAAQGSADAVVPVSGEIQTYRNGILVEPKTSSPSFAVSGRPIEVKKPQQDDQNVNYNSGVWTTGERGKPHLEPEKKPPAKGYEYRSRAMSGYQEPLPTPETSAKPGGEIDDIVAEWRRKMKEDLGKNDQVVFLAPEVKPPEVVLGKTFNEVKKEERRPISHEENPEVVLQRRQAQREQKDRENFAMWKRHIGSEYGMPFIDPSEYDAWWTWHNSPGFRVDMPWEVYKDREARHKWLRDNPAQQSTRWIHPVMEANLQKWAESEELEQQRARSDEAQKEKKKGGFWNWVGSLLEGKSAKDSFAPEEWAEVKRELSGCHPSGALHLDSAVTRRAVETAMDTRQNMESWKRGVQKLQEDARRKHNLGPFDRLELWRGDPVSLLRGRISEDADGILEEYAYEVMGNAAIARMEREGIDVRRHLSWLSEKTRICLETKQLMRLYGASFQSSMSGNHGGGGPCG